MFGREGNGLITVEDLGSAMRLMGKNPSKTHLQQLIDLVDSDGDGMLNFDDFLRMMVLCNLKDESVVTDDDRDEEEEEEEEEEEGDDGEEGDEDAEEDEVRVPRVMCVYQPGKTAVITTPPVPVGIFIGKSGRVRRQRIDAGRQVQAVIHRLAIVSGLHVSESVRCVWDGSRVDVCAYGFSTLNAGLSSGTGRDRGGDGRQQGQAQPAANGSAAAAAAGGHEGHQHTVSAQVVP